MHPMRLFGLAAVCASAVAAGIIESSSGSATAAPAPRSSARRDKCFFVTNIAQPSAGASLTRICIGTLSATPSTSADNR